MQGVYKFIVSLACVAMILCNLVVSPFLVAKASNNDEALSYSHSNGFDFIWQAIKYKDNYNQLPIRSLTEIARSSDYIYSMGYHSSSNV